jgi:hypothetical protein
MAVISVATITVAPGRWDEFVDGSRKAKAILEKLGAKNVRLLGELAGAVGSSAVHSTFEADDLASLGKVMDSIYADPDMLALMQNGTAVSWTSSILGEIPLD